MITLKKAWIFSGALIIFNILFYWLTPEGILLTIVSDLLPILCAIVAVIGISLAVRSFKSFDQTKLAWILLLVGIVLFFLGESCPVLTHLSLIFSLTFLEEIVM